MPIAANTKMCSFQLSHFLTFYFSSLSATSMHLSSLFHTSSSFISISPLHVISVSLLSPFLPIISPPASLIVFFSDYRAISPVSSFQCFSLYLSSFWVWVATINSYCLQSIIEHSPLSNHSIHWPSTVCVIKEHYQFQQCFCVSRLAASNLRVILSLVHFLCRIGIGMRNGGRKAAVKCDVLWRERSQCILQWEWPCGPAALHFVAYSVWLFACLMSEYREQ